MLSVGIVDYAALITACPKVEISKIIAFLEEELPYLWRDAYLEMTDRPTDIVRFRSGSFEYIYDDYASLEASGAVPYDPNVEARLVASFGRSMPKTLGRDDCRLRGWVGRTEKLFGRDWDKGHFIGHCIGGAVDGIEANVFIQRRDLNRGWSAQGKIFRSMERYCFANQGTFCFSRPLYGDLTAKPSFLEFGLVTTTGDLWVETFDNR